MSRYVAVIRLGTVVASGRGDEGASLRSVGSRLLRMAGVEFVDLDRVGDSLLIWFDRARVSLGEIVRAIEDEGVGVSAVAQARADADQRPAYAAIA